jgi:hypothetical protein
MQTPTLYFPQTSDSQAYLFATQHFGIILPDGPLFVN